MAASNQDIRYAFYVQDSLFNFYNLSEDEIKVFPESIIIAEPFKSHIDCKWIVATSTNKVLTGLRPIYKEGIYYGDFLNDTTLKKSLIIANLYIQKTTQLHRAEFIYFPNYYPLTSKELNHFVKIHIDSFCRD